MVSNVVLLLRVVLGAIFLTAGALKIGWHFDGLNLFASQIAGFQLLPRVLIPPLALLLPFVEVLLGAYLILGLFTRIAATFAAIQLAVFAGAIASVLLRGLPPVSCGCFGAADATTTSWPEVARDAGLAILALMVAWRAPGALSLDSRMEHRHEQSSSSAASG
jgi:uncharacterized membrane protein YphA (DoxX/SURF4 family)